MRTRKNDFILGAIFHSLYVIIQRGGSKVRPIADTPYIIGLKLRIYPTNEQKDMIAVNDGVARFIYNRLVARNREMYRLRKVGCYIQPITDRLDYLLSLGQNSSGLKAAYPFLEDNRIDAQTIANAISKKYQLYK